VSNHVHPLTAILVLGTDNFQGPITEVSSDAVDSDDNVVLEAPIEIEPISPPEGWARTTPRKSNVNKASSAARLR
jgi:hypothetical protein